MPQKIKERKSFKVKVIQEGGIPNICIKEPNKKIFAKICIHPNGNIEVRRFIRNKCIGIFINRKGKAETVEYEETMIDGEPEFIED